MVERGLRLGEQSQFVLLYLVGQVVDDGLVALQAAQEERGGDAAEAVGHVAVALALYGIGKLIM